MPMYLGDYTYGSTVYVPFHTFSSDDPAASMTITGLAVTDIEIYKNGNITQRASDVGYTLLDTDGIDFDGITGIHGFSIDTSDNSDAGFYVRGADYWVVVSAITLDAATISFVAAIFSIENRHAAGELLKTTIATLASQTSFTLTAGSADNNAYNNCTAVITDAVTSVQKCVGLISAYTGATKTVTLAEDPGIFTIAAADNISIIATSALANIRTVNGTLQTANDDSADINAILADTNELQTDWVNAGRLDAILDTIAADVVNIDGAAMRGTDNAALASVVGALADAAADGDPTATDTAMQYMKQLINILIGTSGIAAFPAEAAPANAVSLAEVIRAIHADVTGLDGDAMRGTDGANTTTPPTAAAIVDEFETQSQADPTGFHVNVKEVNGTAQTANDNGADINSILSTVDHADYGNAKLVRSTTPANTLDVSATGEAGLDFANIKDATGAHTLTNITVPTVTTVGTCTTNSDMRGTDGANTTVPDAAGTAAALHSTTDAAIAALNNISAADVNTQVDTALSDIHLDHLLATTYDPASKPGVADALLNELVENDAGVARFTENSLEQAPTGGSAPTVEEIRTEIDSNSTQLQAIVEDTAVIGALGAGLTAIPWNSDWDTEVQSEVTDALNSYDPPTKAEMDSGHALLATPAQVNAQVLDVLNTDTFAEPGQGAPTATTTLVQKIGYLYKFLRNKIETTSTTITVYNDDGTTAGQASTISDDGTTTTRGEFGTGA